MRIDFTPDPALYPFTSRWFDSSHGRMHYVDEGSGPVIMFFHGNPTWSFLYRDIITGLRDQFRCIAADYLGFGLSERPSGFSYRIEQHAHVVGELVDHLNLDGYVTMGQDWDGPISMAVNIERADRVRGVVLGNTWFWPAADLPTKVFSKVMGSPLMQWAILQRNFFVEKIIPAATATSLIDAVMEHYRRVQPTPEARAGVARMPKEILAARAAAGEAGPRGTGPAGGQACAAPMGHEGFAFMPGRDSNGAAQRDLIVGEWLLIPDLANVGHHTVVAGETLKVLAQSWYGDAHLWTIISIANHLPDGDPGTGHRADPAAAEPQAHRGCRRHAVETGRGQLRRRRHRSHVDL